MDDGLKQRIVGAFVLVAIGVVFIPVMFDRERIEPLDRKTQIPPAPHIEVKEVQLPEKPTKDVVLKDPHEMFVPSDKQKVTSKPEGGSSGKEPILRENGTPNGWVLQIASYRFEGHAKQRRDELIGKGYSVFIRDVTTKSGKMTRLYVGPNLDKSKITAAKKSIDKLLGVESVVMRFEP